jgi:alpha-L-fucosidase
MTMGDSWSYVPNDHYKSTNQLIHMLCDIVAKGGNLLLNVGPDAEGRLPKEALQRMEEIGQWLELNGVAIYGTRPLYPYSQGNVRYTQSKDGKHRYAICLLEEGQHHSLTVELPFVVKKVRPLAPNAKRKITCKTGKNSTVVSITAAGILQHAVVLEF